MTTTRYSGDQPPARDLYPTPTRRALLDQVDVGNVLEGITEDTEGHTWLVDEPDPPRKITAAMRELAAAGWVELPDGSAYWRLTDAGRIIRDRRSLS